MKKIVIIILAMVLLSFIFNSSFSHIIGEPKALYKLTGYKYIKVRFNSNIIKKRFAKMWAKGYTPVGFNARNNHLYLLFVKSSRDVFQNWAIFTFNTTNVQSVQRRMMRKVRRGWTPMGIAVYYRKVHVLALKHNVRINRLKILKLRKYKRGPDLTRALEKWTDRAFLPVGIYVNRRNTYVLMIKSPYSRSRRLTVGIYSARKRIISSALRRNWQNGLIPWGIARYRKSYILFLDLNAD